ncbi:hypothetical protein HZH68_006247 [Vespula germanica]|uniref:Uncharacterized protein n=1 Tax=Vespula germanica TaxID=30212 RepID=A0A834KB68_VESGE|nr:hypothetical protein HZH68_006247 [Vespula germanica]
MYRLKDFTESNKPGLLHAHHENDDDDLLSLTERAHSRRGLEREENTMLAHIPAYPCAPVCQSIENLPEAF